MIGTAPYLPLPHDHTNNFLKQLKAFKGRLPPPATPITQQEYTEEFDRLREGTSSGISDTTLTMVKKEALYTELREIGILQLNLS